MEILKINVWEKQVKDLNEDVKKLKEMVENRKILNWKLQLILENPTPKIGKVTIDKSRALPD